MWKNLFNKHKKFIKFLFVGGLNTLFGYSTFALLVFMGLFYPFAVILSTILGILFNFKTTGKLVFNNSKDSLLFKFMGVYGIICLLNITFLRVFEILKFNIYFAGAVLILPMAILSFTLNKKFVFKPEGQ